MLPLPQPHQAWLLVRCVLLHPHSKPPLHLSSSLGLGKRFLVPRLYTPGTYLLLNVVFCCVFFT